MVEEWPHQQLQTKAALKKQRPLEEKVLSEVQKKVKQIEKMLEPAKENASLASNTTQEAGQMAYDVAKVCACFISVNGYFWTEKCSFFKQILLF